MPQQTLHGPGGYDPSNPDGSVIGGYDDRQPSPEDAQEKFREEVLAATTLAGLKDAPLGTKTGVEPRGS